MMDNYQIQYPPPDVPPYLSTSSNVDTSQCLDNYSDNSNPTETSSTADVVMASSQNTESSSSDQYTLDEFKVDVRTWIELDDSIKSLQNAIKERRHAKKHLTDRITSFMNTNEIEDLITKNGRIRYKTNYVKAPLSHTDIHDRICTFFESDTSTAKDLLSVVFGTRGRSERSSLRRMKICVSG
jgi:hypothetical protein